MFAAKNLFDVLRSTDEYSDEDNVIEEEDKPETKDPTPNPAITSTTSEDQGEQREQGKNGESKSQKRGNSKKDGSKREESKKDGSKKVNSKRDGSKREESKKDGSKKENSKRDGSKREETKRNDHNAALTRSQPSKPPQGMTQTGPARSLLGNSSTMPKSSAPVNFGSQGKHNEDKSVKKPQRETRQTERGVSLTAKPQRETKQDSVVPSPEEIQPQGRKLSNDEKTNAKRIIALIDGRINSFTPWNEISEKSEIRNITSYFLKEPLSDSDFEQATNCEFELNDVPALLVSFLIEAFAIDQPAEMKYLEEKDYSKLTRVKLNMPVPIPVSLKSNGKDDVCIGFFSTPIMSAKEARDITTIALNNIAIRAMEKVTMTNVEPEYFDTKLLDEFVKKTQCRLLYKRETKQNEEEDDDEEIIRIKVMNQKKYTETFKQQNEEALRNIYKECCLLKCKKCGELYNEHDKECYKKHTGELIVDIEGNECDIDVDEETGEEYHLEEWTCCGEVYREDDGCIPDDERTNYPNGEHESDGEVSVFNITTEAIWPNNKK